MKKHFYIILLVLILITACDNKSTSSNSAPQPPASPTPSHYAINVANITTLRWTCVDVDNDNLTYDVYLSDDDESLVKVASGLTENEYSPDPLDYSTDYHWKVAANDGEDITKSPRWNFRTATEDFPPDDPQNPYPEDAEIDTGVSETLRWYCYDVNGDHLSFDLKFGPTTDPGIVATDLESYSYEVTDLAYHTVYYWQIIAKSTEHETAGPLWSFETRYYNYPPDKPFDPFPDEDDIDVSTHVRFNWMCHDEEGDPLHYDIYLGTDNNPPLLVQNHDYNHYEPDVLEPLTEYYWRIDAWDGGNYSHGQVWHFTTGVENSAPEVPHDPWPQHEATGEPVEAMLRWSCNDPDGDNLRYKVYFGTEPNLSENNVIALGISNESWGLGTLDYNETYYWKIKVQDGDLEVCSPVWSFTTVNE